MAFLSNLRNLNSEYGGSGSELASETRPSSGEPIGEAGPSGTGPISGPGPSSGEPFNEAGLLGGEPNSGAGPSADLERLESELDEYDSCCWRPRE